MKVTKGAENDNYSLDKTSPLNEVNLRRYELRSEVEATLADDIVRFSSQPKIIAVIDSARE